MNRMHLNRRLVLETLETGTDGAGGFVSVWQALGTVWAQLEPAPVREAVIGDRIETVQPVQITLRAAPVGDPSRPLVGQRLREAGRCYRIVGVSERDGRGTYLLCQTREEPLT